MEQTELRALLVQLVRKVLKVLPESMVKMERMEPKVLLVLLEPKVLLV
jgi:hypothetical protein